METGGMKGRNDFGIHYNNFAKALAYQHILNTEQSYLTSLFAGERRLLMLDALGQFNEISLANINSCSFIATQDLGKKNPNNSFEVLGRFDNSDIRGLI
jgi:hypothetical protein